jgi:Tfp pilus assembly protein PilE
MGQQQLLLIILGVIIVGIAVAVGITVFDDAMVTNNRDAVQNDLVALSVYAREYYNKPMIAGGGGHSFVGLTADAAGQLKIAPIDSWSNENGTYTISTAGDAGLVIITGVGRVKLSNGQYPTYDCRVRARKILMQKVH